MSVIRLLTRPLACLLARPLICASALWLLATFSHAQTALEPEPAAEPPAAERAPSDEPVVIAVPAVAAPAATAIQVIEGRVAYYARRFAGRKTANGERHDPAALTMAHLTLPLGTRVRVTNLATQRSVIVRVNDRGPYTRGRVADVSEAAARALRMLRAGVVHARLEVLR